MNDIDIRIARGNPVLLVNRFNEVFCLFQPTAPLSTPRDKEIQTHQTTGIQLNH